MKNKKAAPKKAPKKAAPATAHTLAAVPTFYRAWCETQSIWISANWTTMEQANTDAQTHVNMGHLVDVKQKIG